MKLWLDDLRSPEQFRPKEDWHWVKTNTELIRLLNTVNPDYIEGFAVDHDKSHLVWIDPVELSLSDKPDEKHTEFREFVCDEVYEASVLVMRMWAERYDKRNIPVEIITSNTCKTDPYKQILGERFSIILSYGGRAKE